MITNNTALLGTHVDRFLAYKNPVAFDIETTQLNPRMGKLISLQFMQAGSEPVIIDARTTDLRELATILAPLFSGSVLLLGANLKFDAAWMREKFGIRLVRCFDVMLAEKVLYSGEAGKGYSLKAIADRRRVRLDVPMNKQDREWFYSLDEYQEKWNAPFPERIQTYMSNDVQALFPIYEQQCRELKQKGLIDTAALEFGVLPAVVEMERNGVQLNTEGWRAFIEEKEREASDLQAEIERQLGPSILAARSHRYDQALVAYDQWEKERDEYLDVLKYLWQHCGDQLTLFEEQGSVEQNQEQEQYKGWGDFKLAKMLAWRKKNPNPHKPREDTYININSDEQLMDALRELNIAIPMKRRKGATEPTESLDDESLQEIEYLHPAISLIRKYRKAEKFVKSYGESLLAECDPVTGRFHFQYTQIVSTGRMSASRIQQIPSKGDGKKLRQNVVAAPGSVLIVLDYNAIEMRILAEMSREEELIDAFASGQDIHSVIARSLFDLPDDANTKTTAYTKDGKELKGWTYRDLAKTFEYGAIYGVGPGRISKLLGISRKEAADILNDFFASYPRVEQFMGRMKNNANVMGESRTIGGRARYYEVPPRPTYERYDGERELYNPAMQQWKGVVSSIERAAANHPIQGTSADITKTALMLLYQRLREADLLDTVRIIACIHDEIVVECPSEIASQVGPLVALCMESGAKKYLTRVPVPVEFVSASTCWEK